MKRGELIRQPWARPQGRALFKPREFRVAEDLTHAICPAGRRLYRNGRHCDINGFEAVKFTGAKRDCASCPLRSRCLRHPERTAVRQVVIFLGRVPGKPETWTSRMKRKIDTDGGRHRYSRRLGIVERYLPTSAISEDSGGSATAAAKRSTRSGCSIAWCTTSARCSATGISGNEGQPRQKRDHEYHGNRPHRCRWRSQTIRSRFARIDHSRADGDKLSQQGFSTDSLAFRSRGRLKGFYASATNGYTFRRWIIDQPDEVSLNAK